MPKSVEINKKGLSGLILADKPNSAKRLNAMFDKKISEAVSSPKAPPTAEGPNLQKTMAAASSTAGGKVSSKA